MVFREPVQRRRVVGPVQTTPARIGGNQAPERQALRRPRARELLVAVHRLDAGLDDAARVELAQWAGEHYRTEFGEVPVGLVATCHLGPPLVDHRLDLRHEILDHYSPADTMPDPFARARMLVRTGAYAYVEVYASGTLVPIRDDGIDGIAVH